MFNIIDYNKFEKENKKTDFKFSDEELLKIGAELRIVSKQRLFRGRFIDCSERGLFKKGTSERLNPLYYKFKLLTEAV